MGNDRKEICDAISEMLDNPDACGIYPTTKCYDRLVKYCQAVRREERESCAEIAEKHERINGIGNFGPTPIAKAIRTREEGTR